MLRQTLANFDSHSMAPGAPPLRRSPAGSDHSRGSSLTSQSMVRDATLATPLSDQKIRVHTGAPTLCQSRPPGSRTEPSHGTTAVTTAGSVSYTHLRAHETRHDLVCRLL